MRKIKGFTLVELLVVISIIALLLAMLLPSLNKARELSRRIVCANNIKTMAMGDQMYANESGDWHVPVINGLSPNNEHWFHNPLFIKLIAMQGRVRTEGPNVDTLPKEYKCPTDKRTIGKGLFVDGGVIQGTSYGMNGMGLYSQLGGWHYYSGSRPRLAHALKILQVVDPSSKFFLMDAVWYVVNRDDAAYLTIWDKYGDVMSSHAWDAPAYRHSEGANMVFYDWHSKYLKKQQIYQYGSSPDEAGRLNDLSWLPIPDKEYIDQVPDDF